jgi:hypothetical protein
MISRSASCPPERVRMAKQNPFKSPNPSLEAAIIEAMGRLKTEKVPLDVAVKVLHAAIAWEKTKHAIRDTDDEGYDPDEDEE